MKLTGQTRVIVATAFVLALTDIGVRVATLNRGPVSPNGVVTAREFRLVDRNGVPRATLSVDDSSSEPGLIMYDHNGAPRLQLDTWENNPSLILRDKDGHRKTFFGTEENTGHGILTEYAPDGTAQSTFEIDGNNIITRSTPELRVVTPAASVDMTTPIQTIRFSTR